MTCVGSKIHSTITIQRSLVNKKKYFVSTPQIYYCIYPNNNTIDKKQFGSKYNTNFQFPPQCFHNKFNNLIPTTKKHFVTTPQSTFVSTKTILQFTNKTTKQIYKTTDKNNFTMKKCSHNENHTTPIRIEQNQLTHQSGFANKIQFGQRAFRTCSNSTIIKLTSFVAETKT